MEPSSEMRTLDPVVFLPIVSIAATAKSRHYVEGIPYPMLHALVFYIDNTKIHLGYHFNWHFCLREELEPFPRREEGEQSPSETVWYPHSIELAEDIFGLNAGGILTMRRGSGFRILPGDLVTENPTVFIGRFEREAKLSFDSLSGYVKRTLDNPKKLLDDCYKIYISKL